MSIRRVSQSQKSISRVFRAIAVWADGTHDTARICQMCSSPTCPYPVHQDYYSERISEIAYLRQLENA